MNVNLINHFPRTSAASPACSPPPMPVWVDRWLAERSGEPAVLEVSESETVTMNASGAWLQVGASIAAHADAADIEQIARESYLRLFALQRQHAAGNAVRFWNYVPAIHDAAAPGCDRYMAFNAGRHRAFEQQLGTLHIEPHLVAASAVGCDGRELVVQAFVTEQTPRPIENPRQRPAYRYSRRYGPIPPSFARATVIDDPSSPHASLLLTAGTASVVGEDSAHEGALEAQCREIERNMAALVATAEGAANTLGEMEAEDRMSRRLLRAYRHLRAYVVREDDGPAVRRWLRQAFAGAQTIELVRADLCRRGLLVEVEGVAAVTTKG